jgi:hypothetical protein
MDHFVNVLDLMPIITEESACIQFLSDEGLLHTTVRCSECYDHLSPHHHSNKIYPVFACQRGHKRIISCTKGTWFENLKISPAQILLLTYSIAHKLSCKQTAAQYSLGDGPIAGNMICDWLSYCREVCMLREAKLEVPTTSTKSTSVRLEDESFIEGELLRATGFWGRFT